MWSGQYKGAAPFPLGGLGAVTSRSGTGWPPEVAQSWYMLFQSHLLTCLDNVASSLDSKMTDLR